MIEERNQLDYWSARTNVGLLAGGTMRDGSRDNKSERLTDTCFGTRDVFNAESGHNDRAFASLQR